MSMTQDGKIECEDCGTDAELYRFTSDCGERHIMCEDCAEQYDDEDLPGCDECGAQERLKNVKLKRRGSYCEGCIDAWEYHEECNADSLREERRCR